MMPGRIAVQLVLLSAVLYSMTCFELARAVNVSVTLALAFLMPSIVRLPPTTETWPVERELVPTKRFEVRSKLPPRSVKVPLGILVIGNRVIESVTTVDKATKAPAARTIPLDSVRSPEPSRPTQ